MITTPGLARGQSAGHTAHETGAGLAHVPCPPRTADCRCGMCPTEFVDDSGSVWVSLVMGAGAFAYVAYLIWRVLPWALLVVGGGALLLAAIRPRLRARRGAHAPRDVGEGEPDG